MEKESVYELTLHHILTTTKKLFLFGHLTNKPPK